MKNKTIFTLFIIVLAGLLLRLWNIDKPEGLWNDEYVAWFIASRKSFTEFISLVAKNCHTPLYYVFLKLWLSVFPDNDITLRLSSAFISILTIISMYFTGKEIKDKKTGLLCSVFTAVSSFYIYFAQEVRLYSLLSLVTVLTIYLCIKTLKSGKKRIFCLFIVSNAILCAVHTLGLMFSLFLILFTIIYLYKNNESWKKILLNCKKILQYIFPFLCVLLILSPFIFSILFSRSLSQFWSNFSLSKIAFTFIDYFSPIQCNITNSPDTFRTYFLKDGKINLVFAFFGVFPVFIVIWGVIKGYLLKNKILNVLLYSSLGFYVLVICLSRLGKLIMLSKYTCEIYPVLIIAFSLGILSLKRKAIINTILIIYFSIHLIYLYYSPNSAPKLTRPEGNAAPVMLIEQANLKKGDFVLFTYYDKDKFERYLPENIPYKIFSISKFNFNKPVFNNSNYYETIRQGKMIYRTKFKEFPNQDVINYADNNFISNMKKGDRIAIVFLNGVSFITNERMKEIVEDDKKYKKTSFIFLSFSSLRNSLMAAFKKDYIIESVMQAGDWTLVVYKKIN